jgi:hypothetical protein
VWWFRQEPPGVLGRDKIEMSDTSRNPIAKAPPTTNTKAMNRELQLLPQGVPALGKHGVPPKRSRHMRL